MTIATEARTIGARVSYEDVANPRKLGTVVATLPSAWGTQYGVKWDGTDGDVIDYSDLRQAGWNLEPATGADVSVAAFLVLTQVQARRIPAAGLDAAAVLELIAAGLVRSFRDGREVWLELDDEALPQEEEPTVEEPTDAEVGIPSEVGGLRLVGALIAGELEEEVDGQLVVPVPGAPVGSLELRPSLF